MTDKTAEPVASDREQLLVLLPCPFCGGVPERSHHDYGENGEEVVIVCDSCYAEMRVSDPFDGECEGNWNERDLSPIPLAGAGLSASGNRITLDFSTSRERLFAYDYLEYLISQSGQ